MRRRRLLVSALRTATYGIDVGVRLGDACARARANGPICCGKCSQPFRIQESSSRARYEEFRCARVASLSMGMIEFINRRWCEVMGHRRL